MDNGAFHRYLLTRPGLQSIGAAAVEIAVGNGDILTILSIDDTSLAVALLCMSHGETFQTDITATIEVDDIGVARVDDDMAVLTSTSDGEVVDANQIKLTTVEAIAADLRIGSDITFGVVVVPP